MLTIEVNDAAVIEVLNRAAAQFDNTLPLYQSIGQILLASTIDRFAKGESPEGQKWQPKSPVTLAQYAKNRRQGVPDAAFVWAFWYPEFSVQS